MSFSSTVQGTSSDSATGSQSVFSEANEAEVEFSEIELGPRIGIGCFGEVFKARWRQTTVAVKRLFDQSLSEQSLKVGLAAEHNLGFFWAIATWPCRWIVSLY